MGEHVPRHGEGGLHLSCDRFDTDFLHDNKKIMKVTKIDMSKGDNFKTCIWREATKEEEDKFMKILSNIKKYKQ